MDNSLVIYDAAEGEVVFDIDKEKETIWADAEQIARLFGVTKRNIVTHLANIYKEDELEMKRTWKENFQVQIEGGRQVRRKKNLYNLDAIISVGYRVNSKKATQFRVWATKVLKKYVVNGVAVNERRLKELSAEKLEQIEGTLSLVRRLMEKTELEESEAKGVLEVIANYGKSLETIGEFDAGRILAEGKRSGRLRKNLTIGEVVNLAENLREERGESEKFGELKNREEFEKFLGELETEVGGKTVAEKAARLLYYICNIMPFEEGNRQLGALIFVYFLTINDFRLAEGGETKLSDRALTAMVLLIAEAKEGEEELMINLVTKLLES